MKIKMTSGIYRILNLVNGKYYYGSTCSFIQRKSEHFGDLKLNQHHNDHLQKAYNKYGKDNLQFQVVEYISKENLLIVEQQYLDKYWDDGFMCYNILKCAEAPRRGTTHSEEAKRKIREAHRGKKKPQLSIQHKEKLRQLNMGEGNPFYGRHHTETTKENLSRLNTGKTHTEASRKKISEAGKGRRCSEETKQKIREANTGKCPTLETRKKLSEANKGKKRWLGKTHSEETKKKMSEAQKNAWAKRKLSVAAKNSQKRI